METGPPTLPRSTSESKGKAPLPDVSASETYGIYHETPFGFSATAQGQSDCPAVCEDCLALPASNLSRPKASYRAVCPIYEGSSDVT